MKFSKMNIKVNRRAVSMGAGILAGLVLLGGIFYGGVRYGETFRSVKITDSSQLLNADFSFFWNVVDIVKNKYVNAEKLNDQDLLYGAVKGVVDAVGDPYTEFLKPSDAEKFSQDLSGSFGGIGAQIDTRGGQLIVITPLKKSPAEAAGLKPGDTILKVDDTVTNNLSVEEAVKLIRGEPGTVVKLLIFRDGWDSAREIPVTRQIIEVPTVDWKLYSLNEKGKVVHLQLYNFNANSPSLFYNAVADAFSESGGVSGVVLDLRNNPGGYLDVAVHLAGWFLDHGAVVTKERFRDGTEEVFRANGNEALARVPVVVLVNGGSASASEILAGALRDERGVKLVGEKTFGKGSVQEVEELPDGSSLKVTIAEWLTPHGGQINEKGLIPDVAASSTSSDATSTKDMQLEKALEVLSGELQPLWTVTKVEVQ